METGDEVVTTWRTAAANYATDLALAQKDGILPTSDGKKLPIPDDRNAAMLYRKMVARDETPPNPSTETLLGFRDLHNPMPAQVHDAYQAALSSPERHLALAATALPDCDFERSPGGPAPELAALRLAARILSAESLLLTYLGRVEEAIRNQALVFRVTQHAAAGSMLIDWLVAVAVDAIGLAGMAQILTLRGSDAATAASIARTLEQDWRPLTLAPVMAAEAAWQQEELARVRQIGFLPYLLHTVDEMYADFSGETAEEQAETEQARQQERAKLEGELEPVILRALRADTANETVLLDASAAFSAYWMQKLYAAVDQPYPQAKPVVTAFRRDLDTPSTLPDGQMAMRLIPEHLMGTLAAPLEFKSYETARGLTLLAAARLLAQQGASHYGTFPDTVRDLPPDPFTGDSLHYRKEGRGFVIFSVGPDGVFDGGQPGIPVGGQPSSLLFRYAG